MKLYKRTSTGATQVWWQEIENDKYRTHSGQDGGAIVVSEWTTAKPKNEGKANATTGEQQAKLEVEANYVLKRKKGYGDTVEEAQASTRFSPMLAKEYEDQKKVVLKALSKNEPVVVQTKLDGVRCIATKDGLWSRGGNPIVAVPHIVKALESFFEANPEAILDGELYNHDLRDDFPKLISLVRKTKPTAEDFKESEVMQYWVYDFVSPGSYLDRMRTLRRNYDNDELRRRRRNFYHAEAVCHGLWRMEKDVYKYGNHEMVAAFKAQIDAARQQCDIAEQAMLDFERRNDV